jgi:predicted homoserine dehydrogenase-like protein
VYSAVLHGRSSGSTSQQQHALMVARATRDLRAGEVLAMGGHMHEMQGVTARLVPAREAPGAAPYYLAANKRLLHDVACGSDIPAAALALDGSALARAWASVASPGPH